MFHICSSDLEQEPLPDEIPAVEKLIADHKEFMENTARRQPEVDRACKPKVPPAGTKEASARKPSRQLKTPVYVSLQMNYYLVVTVTLFLLQIHKLLSKYLKLPYLVYYDPPPQSSKFQSKPDPLLHVLHDFILFYYLYS